MSKILIQCCNYRCKSFEALCCNNKNYYYRSVGYSKSIYATLLEIIGLAHVKIEEK